VALLAGTSDTTAPVETNIKRIAGLLPKADVTMLPGASHYTFIDICLPAAADARAIICKDNPGIDRDAVHAQAIERARAFFATALPAKE
jgi:predicted dienelactone hydrolase